MLPHRPREVGSLADWPWTEGLGEDKALEICAQETVSLSVINDLLNYMLIEIDHCNLV